MYLKISFDAYVKVPAEQLVPQFEDRLGDLTSAVFPRGAVEVLRVDQHTRRMTRDETMDFVPISATTKRWTTAGTVRIVTPTART